MRYISAALYLLIMVSLVVVGVFGATAQSTLAVATFSVFTILAHIFVVLARKTRTLIAGVLAHERVGSIPDLAVVLLLANYALAIILIQPLTSLSSGIVAFAGLAVTATVVLLHLFMETLVRLPIEKVMKIDAILPKQERVSKVIKQVCLRLREAVAVLSAINLLLLAKFGLAPIFVFITCVIVGIVGALVAGIYFARNIFRLTETQTKKAIDSYFDRLQPQYLLHYSAPTNKNSTALLAWLARLQPLGFRFIIIVRELHHFSAAVKAGFNNVIYVKTMAELEQHLHPSLKLAVYINESAKNAQLVRFNNLTQVLLTNPKNSSNALNVYDKVVVSDIDVAKQITQAGILDPEKIMLLGKKGNDATNSALAASKPRFLTIAYQIAPIDGDWAASAYWCRKITHSIKEHARLTRLLVSAAPRKEENLVAASVERGLQRCFHQPSQDSRIEFYTHKEMPFDIASRQADILIMSEAAVTHKILLRGQPIILLPSFSDEESGNLQDSPIQAACYRLSADCSNLEDLLDLIFEEDPLWKIRKQLQEETDAQWRPLTLQDAFTGLALESYAN